jgi:Ran GTPase-activating protein (RanGAP) involved in mRNA processing and transport
MSNKDLKYKNKYLKYKNKYLDLQSQIGGTPPPVIEDDGGATSSVVESDFMRIVELFKKADQDVQDLLSDAIRNYSPGYQHGNWQRWQDYRNEILISLKDKLRLNKSVTKQDMFISVPIHVYHPEYLSFEETLILAKIFINNIEYINIPLIQYMLTVYIPEFVALHHLNTPLVFNLQNLKIFILAQGSLEPLRLRFDDTHHTSDNQLQFELFFIFLCILLRQINFPLVEIEFNNINLILFKHSFLRIIFGLNKNIIKKLIFKYSRIKDSEVVALANALTTNTSLTTLYLDGDIKDEGAIALANALKQNTTLEILHFYYRKNNSVDEGAIALANALKNNTTLKTLDLSRISFNEKGFTALANALQNATLTILDLRSTFINDERVKALADALKKNNTLTTLYLMNNLISDIGATELADALDINTILTTLNLDGNEINIDIITLIETKLKRNASQLLITINRI